MGTKKHTKDPLTHQLPVRFSEPDWARLDVMQEKMSVDRSEIIRWSLRAFFTIAEAYGWQVSSRGELLRPQPESEVSKAPLPVARAKTTPR